MLKSIPQLRQFNSENEDITLQGFRINEGLGCVLFRAVLPQKTRNLALPSLKNPVQLRATVWGVRLWQDF